MYLAVMDEPMRRNPELFEPVKKGRINAVERLLNELLRTARALEQSRAVGISSE